MTIKSAKASIEKTKADEKSASQVGECQDNKESEDVGEQLTDADLDKVAGGGRLRDNLSHWA